MYGSKSGPPHESTKPVLIVNSHSHPDPFTYCASLSHDNSFVWYLLPYLFMLQLIIILIIMSFCLIKHQRARAEVVVVVVDCCSVYSRSHVIAHLSYTWFGSKNMPITRQIFDDMVSSSSSNNHPPLPGYIIQSCKFMTLLVYCAQFIFVFEVIFLSFFGFVSLNQPQPKR